MLTHLIDQAFEGFIGNDNAIYQIKRGLAVALSRTPVALDRTYLLTGQRSTGKTEIARRITATLKLPLVKIDGKIANRESLFELIDQELASRERYPQRTGEASGLPTYTYPPFILFIDECHQLPDRVQQSLLTALERKDRTITLNSSRVKKIALLPQMGVILATTKPAALDDAFRSRTTEIRLERYNVAQITAMLLRRYPEFPPTIATRIAKASRLVPRIAIDDLGQDLSEEYYVNPDDSPLAMWQRILDTRGIRTADGLTNHDLDYLVLLEGEAKPLGERVILAMLRHIDPAVILEDIEPHLLALGYIRATERGREITTFGLAFIRGPQQQPLL